MEASALPAPVRLNRLSLTGPLLRLRSDEQLVALFRAGSEDAFRVIHDRYRQRLTAYMRQMLGGSLADAEDAMQDVLVRAYAALRRDERTILLKPWLYRVARNRCLDHLRRPSADGTERVEDLVAVAGETYDPTVAAERREDMRRLIADVRRLPEQQRSVLLMRELEGLSYQQLAEAHDTSMPAIKSLLVRARVGLVEAAEARDTACTEIRADLALAYGRGVRANSRARRHLRECSGCREYRSGLRAVERRLSALAPGGGLLGLLGLGGGGGGGAAAGAGGAVSTGGSAGALAGGSTLVGGGAATVTATKLAAVVCAAAVTGAGAASVERHIETPPAPAARIAPARPAATPAAARAATAPARAARTRPAVAPHSPVAAPAANQPPATPNPLPSDELTLPAHPNDATASPDGTPTPPNGTAPAPAGSPTQTILPSGGANPSGAAAAGSTATPPGSSGGGATAPGGTSSSTAPTATPAASGPVAPPSGV